MFLNCIQMRFVTRSKKKKKKKKKEEEKKAPI